MARITLPSDDTRPPVRPLGGSQAESVLAAADKIADIARAAVREANPVPVDPDLDREPQQQGLAIVAVFDVYEVSLRTLRNGDMVLSMLIPKHQKYAAMPITDQPGVVQQVRVYVDPYAVELANSDDPFDGELDGWGD